MDILLNLLAVLAHLLYLLWNACRFTIFWATLFSPTHELLGRCKKHIFFLAVCCCRSTAPCSGEVDSRSEGHPVGWDEIDDLPQHPGRINALFSLTWNRWKWTIPVKSRKTSLSNFWVGDVFCLLNFGQILCPVQQVCAFTFGTWGGEDTKGSVERGWQGAHVQS